jgi:hypothetical protein
MKKFVLALLASAALILPFASAASASPVAPSHTANYKSIIGDPYLQGVGTSQCVDDTNGFNNIGNQIQSNTCNQDVNQAVEISNTGIANGAKVNSTWPYNNSTCSGCNNSELGDQVVYMQLGPSYYPLPGLYIGADISTTPANAVMSDKQILVLVPSGSHTYIADPHAANHAGTIEFLGNLGTSGNPLSWSSDPTSLINIVTP